MKRGTDAGAAGAWLRLQPPLWIPFVWWAAQLATIVASMVGDPLPMCTTQQPCGADPVFPLVMALTVASAASVWWLPTSGLALGAVAAVLSLAFDPSVPGRWAGALSGFLAVGLILLLRGLRHAQTAAAVSAGQALPVPAWGQELLPPRLPGRMGSSRVVPAVVGLAGVLLVVLSAVAFVHQTGVERAHTEHAVRAVAVVQSHSDDSGEQMLRVEDGDRAGQPVRIETLEELDVGTSWDILLDPSDPEWARLVAEPRNYADWLGWGLLGGLLAGWSILRELARLRARTFVEPVSVHRVRCVGSGRAELALGAIGGVVAEVSLDDRSDLIGRRGGNRRPDWRPVVVRGAFADGLWVQLQTSDGLLPVAGPVRAVVRWSEPALLDKLSVPHRLADRIAGTLPVLGRVFMIGLAGFLTWFAVHQAGPAWSAAHGRGIPGTVVVMSEDCGGKGGCHYSGDFRSSDGQYHFEDVELVGASGDVGSGVPVFYEGDGETPDAVYGPGWGGLMESGFFLGMALLTGGEPLARLGEAAMRRRPPSGRHAAS